MSKPSIVDTEPTEIESGATTTQLRDHPPIGIAQPIPTVKPDTVSNIIVEITNSDHDAWYDNIKIHNNNKRCYIVKDRLSTNDRYELTHLIFSYIAFSNYVSQLENVIYNKPLSLVHLGFINYGDIIKPMDGVETSVKALKKATNDLYIKISDDIYKHIRNGSISIAAMSNVEYVVHIGKNIFGMRRQYYGD